MKYARRWQQSSGTLVMAAAMLFLLSTVNGRPDSPGEETCRKKNGLVILVEFKPKFPM